MIKVIISDITLELQDREPNLSEQLRRSQSKIEELKRIIKMLQEELKISRGIKS